MRPVANLASFVDAERVRFDDAQMVTERFLQLGQSGDAAPVALYGGYLGASLQDGSGQPAGTRSHLVDAWAVQIAGHRSDAGQQLAVEDEVLSERLAGAKAVASNDVAQRLDGRAHGASDR